jgi:hypothetical protein
VVVKEFMGMSIRVHAITSFRRQAESLPVTNQGG